MMTLENEIFNLNGAMNLLAELSGDGMDTPEIVLDAFNIGNDFEIDSDDWYDLLVEMANNELDPDEPADYEAVNNFYSDGAIQVNRIDRNSDLLNGLIQWYGTLDNVVNHVRSAALVNGSLYFLTGIGYDTFAADVLNMKDNEHARQIFNKVITGGDLTNQDQADLRQARK